ncbi:MAG: YvcK family protein [Firmicutes bacterium]|nr:YvcK family protein [Bacillota bacterium]
MIGSSQPKIVALGGGTGLSTMLRGLKKLTQNITAIVAVTDDGGGSGMLRKDLGMLPPGDIRSCILALAEIEPLMAKLMQYRFDEGCLKGQCFGNLFLAAMHGVSNSFDEAVQRVGDVLRVTGRVLPVTADNAYIEAYLENGDIIKGESNITLSDKNAKIKRISIKPENVKPLPDVLKAIREADIIVMGPGSLYTSIIPNIIVKGVADEIMRGGALLVYVCNIMTQPGETDGMDAYRHAAAICEHAGGHIIDYCIVNKQAMPDELLEQYIKDGAEPVQINKKDFTNIKLVEGNFVHIKNGHLRHDYNKLAAAVLKLCKTKYQPPRVWKYKTQPANTTDN